MIQVLKNWYWRFRLREQLPIAGFDRDWYLSTYHDVCASCTNPEVHYLRFGRAEGRDINPHFSVSGYLSQLTDTPEILDPFEHYENWGRYGGLDPLPEFAGGERLHKDRPTWLLVGHQAGTQLYGAERSLIDLAQGLTSIGVNVVVVLPSALNREYVAALRRLSVAVKILPYGWWRAGRETSLATVDYFLGLIAKYQANVVYANTLVLHEPLLAAKAEGAKTVVHVRELVGSDEALQRTLGAREDDIRALLEQLADVVVANSRYTGASLGLSRYEVVRNPIRIADFAGLPRPYDSTGSLTFGMISSNLPKKGLYDFLYFADRLSKIRPTVRFCLIGPENDYVQKCKAQPDFQLPESLSFLGYAQSPQEGMLNLDVLLNLSQVKESFGRTVLEAMAAGRPVLAYDWGAMPELIVDQEVGRLVPFGDIDALVRSACELIDNPDMAGRMGQRGSERAGQEFGQARFEQELAELRNTVERLF